MLSHDIQGFHFSLAIIYIHIFGRSPLPKKPYQQQGRAINILGLQALSHLGLYTFTNKLARRCIVLGARFRPGDRHTTPCESQRLQGKYHNNYKGMCHNVFWGSLVTLQGR